VNFEPSGDGRGAAYQPVRLGARILDFHVADRNLCSFWDRARPRVVDLKRAHLVIKGARGDG